MGGFSERITLSDGAEVWVGVRPAIPAVQGKGDHVIAICLPCGAYLGNRGDELAPCHPDGGVRWARACDVQFGPDGTAIRAVPLEDGSR